MKESHTRSKATNWSRKTCKMLADHKFYNESGEQRARLEQPSIRYVPRVLITLIHDGGDGKKRASSSVKRVKAYRCSKVLYAEF